jgi:hypothetical protein
MICLKASLIKTETEPDKLFLRVKVLEEQLKKLKENGITLNPISQQKTDNSKNETEKDVVNKIVTNSDKQEYTKETDSSPLKKEENSDIVKNKEDQKDSITDAIEKDETIRCILEENNHKSTSYRLNNDSKGNNIYKDKTVDLLNVWGRIVTFLKNNGKFTLYSMASEIKESDIILQDTTLTISLKDKDEYDYFTRQDSLKIINELLFSLFDKDLKIEFKYPIDDKSADEAIEKMQDLFDKYSLTVNKK